MNEYESADKSDTSIYASEYEEQVQSTRLFKVQGLYHIPAVEQQNDRYPSKYELISASTSPDDQLTITSTLGSKFDPNHFHASI